MKNPSSIPQKQNKTKPRRRLLKALGISGLLGAAYSYHRGIRFPLLGLESPPLKKQISQNGLTLQLGNLISTPDSALSFRAYAPEPSLKISSDSAQTVKLLINNLSVKTRLTSDNIALQSITEQVNGISRSIELPIMANQTVNLKWQLDKAPYQFAAIGDTGGSGELAWCLQRVKQLDVDFLLHLGDFNYQDGEYASAIELFKQSAIPCYISIGNHDFRDNGLNYQDFLDNLGPLNHQFNIGNTRFVNIDTAATFFPYHGGLRGKLLRQLEDDNSDFASTVVFTHKPLFNPVEPNEPSLGNKGETEWLIKQLKAIKASHVLSGHLHIFNRQTVAGIDNIIVGQGLGHQDLLAGKDISKFAIGKLDENDKVEFSFAPLAMPFELHCHLRTQSARDSISDAKKAAFLEKACQKDSL